MKKFLRLFALMALLLTGLQQATAASLATYWISRRVILNPIAVLSTCCRVTKDWPIREFREYIQ